MPASCCPTRCTSFRNRLSGPTGKFVFHCHILAHEDAGMMQSVKVVK
ncbi:MAG: multicopper oxidase domain-containing protein [Gemmatimonadota bacterium]